MSFKVRIRSGTGHDVAREALDGWVDGWIECMTFPEGD